MSREIKFRVFDTKQMKFLEINDFIDETWQFNGVAGFGNIGVLAYQIRENGELNSKLICDDERFKIEQFTGLYDKDKTEIYEGDYIRILRSAYLVKFDSWSASFKLFNIKTKKYKNFYQNIFTKNLMVVTGNKNEFLPGINFQRVASEKL